jgi:hypothetical protein
LGTKREYGDFELELEYRLPPKGNSGIFVHAPADGDPSGSKFLEVQLIDEAANPYGANHDTAAICNVLAPSTPVKTTPNQWHKIGIKSLGRRLQVVFDGQQVLDANLDDTPKRHPGLANTTGRIGLQHYNTGAEFRNIRIKDLNKAANGFVPLFNGKDLTGWSVVPSEGAEWKVVGGALNADGPRSYLNTDRDDYADFHLRVVAKINERGNSGVFVRTTKAGYVPPGYEAQINIKGDAYPTGSLYGKVKSTGPAVEPDTWFTMEVIAEGYRIRIRVNGKETADYTDPDRRWRKGRISLQNNSPETDVFFKSVEIKELKPSD